MICLVVKGSGRIGRTFDGAAFYEENYRNKTLTIFTSRPGDVSVRFIAPRYDAAKWPNLRDDQYDPFTHHVLDEK
jgi:hypothetical protein